MKTFYARKREFEIIREFVHKPGAGLTYLRGRRRVGKSFLLRHFQSKTPNCFYFAGAQDADTRQTLKDFAIAWDQFSLKSRLSSLNSYAQNWSLFFQEITNTATNSTKPLVLIFDEVQWIAKIKSGFVGRLKAAWDDWQNTGRIKVILCGSSNKFFTDNTGPEKTLRGLKTHAEIWVHPFSLKEVKKYYFHSWSNEEICLICMMLGGIPYYLEQIPRHNNFIQAVNQCLFTRSTIFLDEINEILSLEFNKNSSETIKTVLSSLGISGAPQKSIEAKTGLPRGTIYDTLNKLMDYNLVFKELPINTKPRLNEAGHKYFMKDFYLNFYFQVLENLTIKIKKNKSGLIFPYDCIGSHAGYYIPSFTGPAFELLVRDILENKMNTTPNIFKKLSLLDENYKVGSYWQVNKSQIDLVVEHKTDRESRLIECKWVSQNSLLDAGLFTELKTKDYPRPSGYKKSCYLITSGPISTAVKQRAHESSVGIVTLEDLF
ncbi:MAG: AAA family ATPase [Deltaproteobacteria bacterium]|nr:AAA family ATPase [Deltaproteobacteria bacterium]